MSASSQRPDPKPTPRLEQAGASDESIQKVHTVLMREKPEPAEGYAPIPIVLLFLFCGLVFWGGVYVERYSGSFNPLVYDHTIKGDAPPPAPPPIDPMKVGGTLYAAQCVACHQANGQGLAGNFPPLAGSEWVIGPDSEKLLPRILLHGLQGPVTVMGNEYNGVMPNFRTYKDPQIAAILTYIRASWGNNAPPITPEEVGAVRAKYGNRGPWTAADLKTSINE